MFYHPLFGFFIIFILWFTYKRRKHAHDDEKRSEDFWLAEHEANIVRRVNLDALHYITLPLDRLPISAEVQDALKVKTTPDVPAVLAQSAPDAMAGAKTKAAPDVPAVLTQSSPGVSETNIYVRNSDIGNIDIDSVTSISECENIITALSSRRILNLTGMTSTDIKFKYGAANLTALDSYDANYTIMVRTLYRWASLLAADGRTEDAICVLEFGIGCLTDISGHYKLLAELYVKNNEVHKIDTLIETAGRLNSLMKDSIINNLTNMRNNLT